MTSAQLTDTERVIAEHAVQLRLFDAIHDAIEDNKGVDEVGEMFEQLLDYSRIHFLSEELLMRLHAYDGYRDHVHDHEQIVDEMQALHQQHEGGTRPLSSDAVEQLRTRLMRHITGRDAALHGHVAAIESGAA